MNLTPDDVRLAQHFVACMDDTSTPHLTVHDARTRAPLESGGDTALPASNEAKWEAAVLLVAMVRKLNWTPPATEPSTT